MEDERDFCLAGVKFHTLLFPLSIVAFLVARTNPWDYPALVPFKGFPKYSPFYSLQFAFSCWVAYHSLEKKLSGVTE